MIFFIFSLLVQGISKDYQVFYSIVMAVAIYVVYVFIRREFSSKMRLHDMSVFTNLLSIWIGDGFVFVGRLSQGLKSIGAKLLQVRLRETRSTTKAHITSPLSMFRNLEFFVAGFASKFHLWAFAEHRAINAGALHARGWPSYGLTTC